MKYFLTRSQAQNIDIYTQEEIGIPGIVLMEKAAEKLAYRIDRVIKKGIYEKLKGFEPKRDKILAIVESGNNGGDAVAAVRILKTLGYDTAVYEIGAIDKMTESYTKQAEIASRLGVKFLQIKKSTYTAEDLADSFSNYRIVIDGIFGVGLGRNVKDLHSVVISGINLASQRGTFVVGCDIPSGISADDGSIQGSAVDCDMTVTFDYTKYGMLFNEGREFSGDIYTESIGLYKPKTPEELVKVLSGYDAVPYVYYEYDKDEAIQTLPARKEDSNKGTYGKVLIVAGSKDVYGALWLSASACFRSGAGMVKVVTNTVNRDLLMQNLPEAMLLTYDQSNASEAFERDYAAAIRWADVVLIGPGIGESEMAKKLLDGVIENCHEKQSLVFDADAINLIAKDKTTDQIRKMEEKVGPEHIVFTPHVAEMTRLLKGLKADLPTDFVKENRERLAYLVSDPLKIICVLKDARTIISYAGEIEGAKKIYVNTTGNSGMSKGGSGDVLAGMVAGLLAQNKEGKVSNYELTCAAVHLHGRAGDAARTTLGEKEMLAGDLIKFMDF